MSKNEEAAKVCKDFVRRKNIADAEYGSLGSLCSYCANGAHNDRDCKIKGRSNATAIVHPPAPPRYSKGNRITGVLK